MLALWSLVAPLAFSQGGGEGADSKGNPLLQSCDAISICEPVCPTGMTAVAPPERSPIYVFGTSRAGKSSYVPDEIVPLELELTWSTIRGKRNAGEKLVGNESAKYLGLLMYAVDHRERKVGRWELPIEGSPRFWMPPDPGCEGRSLMHYNVIPKGVRERFLFRAPQAGTGPIT
jgi:hypothetical protein